LHVEQPEEPILLDFSSHATASGSITHDRSHSADVYVMP
jgi:hypothetical protein